MVAVALEADIPKAEKNCFGMLFGIRFNASKESCCFSHQTVPS